MFDWSFFADTSHQFVAEYKCFSVALCNTINSTEKATMIDCGGKILLPHSALDLITRLNWVNPMMFKLTNVQQQGSEEHFTHCGVLEFHQEEGICYSPHWMMRNLLLSEGDMVRVQLVDLPVGTYVKFQPQDKIFLTLFNPSAVLELKLRAFACLTVGDMISIEYNNKIMKFYVQELRPANAVSIIECDLNVEFDTPASWSEEICQPAPSSGQVERVESDVAGDVVQENSTPPPRFPGVGVRVDGKKRDKDGEEAAAPMPAELASSRGLKQQGDKLDNEKTNYLPDENFDIKKFQFDTPSWFKEGEMDALGRPLKK